MMNLNKKIRFVLWGVLLAVSDPLHMHAQGLENRIDQVINPNFGTPNGPGAVFMVAHKGQAIYHKAFGKANLELEVNMTTENVFQLGSITKQFTAIAILLLEEKGKLNVKDILSTYLPDYPQGNKITIHHLLTHTSGIRDFTGIKSLPEIAQKELTPKEMVDFFKNEKPAFLPGEKFEYNNAGYVLLGHLIELISGETYENFIKKHLFEKAGMTHSFYANDRQVIPYRAAGYHKKEHNYLNRSIISFSVPFSAGSLMSTTGDMLKWQNALTHHLLLSASQSQKAFRTYLTNKGEPINYGYGWHIRKRENQHSIEHGGSIFGFKTMGIYLPDEDLYVIGLTNCDCNSPTKVVGDIAEMILKMLKKN